MKKVLILSIVLVLLFSLCSCDMEPTTDKQVPIYEGMTISSATAPITKGIDEKTRVFANGFLADKDDKGNNFKDVEIESEDYYADLGEDIFITIHINNPDNFEILSFTLNGEKYCSYMFEYGSNMESIIIKCNVGRESGEHEYTIDAIKYVDKQAIKDVMIRGNQTIKVVVSEFEHEANCKHDDPEKLELIPARDATCQEIGLGEGTKCNRCDTIIVPQPTFDTIDCVESDWIVDKAPTETEEGLRHTECTMCGKVMNEEVTSWGSEGLAYKVNDDGETCTITGMGSCTDANLIIPACIDGYKVTAIGECAFCFCESINRIVVANTVTVIDDYAFEECSDLISIYVPESVKAIGTGTFDACLSLENITVDKKNAYYTDIEGNLYSKDEKILVHYAAGKNDKEFVVPKSVSTVESTFSNCVFLEKIILPESVNSINLSFSGCVALESIIIPYGIDTIKERAFESCTSLKTVIIPNSVKKIESFAFIACTSLESIVIPASVLEFGEGVFNACTTLKEIKVDEENICFQTIEGNLYTRDGRMIRYAPSKANKLFVIPDSVRTIDMWAFNLSNNLESIIITKSLEKLKENAFAGCTSLLSVYYDGTLAEWNETIGDNWNGGYGIKFSVYCSDGEIDEEGIVRYYGVYSQGLEFTLNDDGTSYSVTGIGTCADVNISIPDKYNDLPVTNIDHMAFDGCSAIVSVIVPDSVTSIGWCTFQSCWSLKKIVISKSVSKINEWAFHNCVSLINIDVDSDNQHYLSIDGNLYSKDKKTLVRYAIGQKDTTFIIPEHVTKINDLAFDGACKLTNLSIPKSVSCMGYSVFEGCSSLTEIVIPSSVTQIGYLAFERCPYLTIYCEAESKPAKWDNRWNNSNCPVIWGYTGE